MRTRLVPQFAPILLLLVAATDGFFFGQHKKLLDLYHLLKGKHEQKTPHDVRHYHVHYHPVPIQVWSEKPVSAPQNDELDKLHDDRLTSLGWSDYEYNYVPRTKVSVPRSLHGPWSQSSSSWIYDDGAVEAGQFQSPVGQHDHPGLVVQVPVHQQIIVKHPAPKKEAKPNPFAAFLRKLKNVKEALFSKDEEFDEKREEDEEVSISHNVDSFVLLVPSKSLNQP